MGAPLETAEIATRRLRTDSTAYLLRRASHEYAKALQLALAEHGITAPQFYYLNVLWRGDGLNQAALSALLGVDPGTAKVALAGLEQRGLIHRVRDPEDQRSRNVFVTAEGRARRKVIERAAKGVTASALSGLRGPDVARLKVLLGRVLANFA
jgi:MarR family transcriptional regulator, lower aerobic nicotinate degradation pathway regulator